MSALMQVWMMCTEVINVYIYIYIYIDVCVCVHTKYTHTNSPIFVVQVKGFHLFIHPRHGAQLSDLWVTCPLRNVALAVF